MSLSMYQASAPVLARALKALSGVLQKGADFAKERNVAPEVLLNTRVIADMFPLTRQVQIATDMAKGAVYRLAGQDVPTMEDNETHFEQLQERIANVVAMIERFTPEQIDGSEAREIVLKMRSGEKKFTGQDYLFGFVLPNVYFHAATAYSILRSQGVQLGKADFIGQ